MLADAKAAKTATLTLTARFQRDTGKAIIAYLPGKNYGTPADEQVLLATHTDAMSLIEENGGLGMLGIMSYFNHLPRQSRPRTLAFYCDCRHFMPGGEASWPQFDYYTLHPERLKPIVATIVTIMGGRQTTESGPGGNHYVYSGDGRKMAASSPACGCPQQQYLAHRGCRAATGDRWPRVDVKSGNTGPGVNGGFRHGQKSHEQRPRL